MFSDAEIEEAAKDYALYRAATIKAWGRPVTFERFLVLWPLLIVQTRAFVERLRVAVKGKRFTAQPSRAGRGKEVRRTRRR